jgi:hypothetical protein
MKNRFERLASLVFLLFLSLPAMANFQYHCKFHYRILDKEGRNYDDFLEELELGFNDMGGRSDILAKTPSRNVPDSCVKTVKTWLGSSKKLLKKEDDNCVPKFTLGCQKAALDNADTVADLVDNKDWALQGRVDRVTVAVRWSLEVTGRGSWGLGNDTFMGHISHHTKDCTDTIQPPDLRSGHTGNLIYHREFDSVYSNQGSAGACKKDRGFWNSFGP